MIPIDRMEYKLIYYYILLREIFLNHCLVYMLFLLFLFGSERKYRTFYIWVNSNFLVLIIDLKYIFKYININLRILQ